MDIDLYKDSEKIIELKYNDIELKKNKFIIKKNLDIPIMINFYLPDCKHCKKIVNVWEDTSIRFNNDFKFYSVNCNDIDNNNDLISRELKIKEYPSIMYTKKDNLSKLLKYNGRITNDDMLYFISYYI